MIDAAHRLRSQPANAGLQKNLSKPPRDIRRLFFAVAGGHLVIFIQKHSGDRIADMARSADDYRFQRGRIVPPDDDALRPG